MQARDFPQPVSIRAIPRPMVKVCLAFLCGIVYARFFPFSLTVAFIALLLLPLAWVMVIRRGIIGPKREFHGRMLLILAALLGAARMQITTQNWLNKETETVTLSQRGAYTIAGTVEEIQTYETGGAVAIVSGVTLEKGNHIRHFPGKLELRASSEELQKFLPGDRLQTEGTITPVRGPSVPTAIDSQIYRYSQNLFGSVYLKTGTTIQRLESASGYSIRGYAYQAVNRIRNLIPRRTSNSNEFIGLYASICFGLRSFLPGDLNNSLIRSGLAHLISVSGLHVTTVLIALTWALKQLGLKRKQAAWITTGFTVLYVILVGRQIPILRSAMMAFVVIGSCLTERRFDPLNSLALAAILLLTIYPAELFLPSFQLSFAAVLLLFLSIPMNLRIQQWIPIFPFNRMLQGLFTSTVLSIGLAPIVIPYFHYFSWGAIPGNLIAIPIANILLPLTYAWVLVSLLPFPWLSVFLGDAANLLMGWLIAIIHFFGSPLFSFEVTTLPVYSSALLFLAILLLFTPRAILGEIHFIPIRAIHAALAIAALILWLPIAISPWQPMRVDFLALGQGDCTVIRTPDNRIAIVDGGPSPRFTSANWPSRLVQFLQSEGVKQIDFLLLTHPQSDHIGALEDVVRHFPVSCVLEGIHEAQSDVYQKFQAVLSQHRVPRKFIQRGVRIDLGSETTFWVLNPEQTEAGDNTEINEQSVVVLMQYLDRKILLTSDITEAVERDLCLNYDHWNADVLKVPHHGSRYSSSAPFLEEVHPQFAIIQVGRNPYGHPSDEAINRLLDIGAHVLRTDDDGTVRLRLWRDRMSLSTTRSNQLFIYETRKTND